MSATFDALNYDNLATKGDLKDLRFEMQEMKEDLQLEMQEIKNGLQNEMQKMRYDLLKWQAGFAVALGAIMAKGFGWLGF